MENSAIKLKYKDISVFNRYEFQNLEMKLKKTATNNIAASHINHVLKEINRVRTEMADVYLKDIREVFAKRNEAGEIDMTGAQPGQSRFFLPDETKKAEFDKATEEFGEKVAEFKWRPLTPSTLKDIPVSAEELEMLGDIYTENEGPGIPNLQNVQQMKRK